jgi:hypothetical protein
MKRKKIATETETLVLTRSRRRCALCFGLDGDVQQKAGQLANLDQDPGNGQEDNLAYLCISHHDQYDSRTSQSKGLTANEVKRYRTLLYERLPSLLDEPHSPATRPTGSMPLTPDVNEEEKIPKAESHPLWSRLTFLDSIEDDSDVSELEDRSKELIDYAALLKRGKRYSKLIRKLVKRSPPWFVIATGESERFKLQQLDQEREYRDQLLRARDQVYALVVELLRLQK